MYSKYFKNQSQRLIEIANGIEDKNSIRVGEKLYIPKYIKKEAGEQVEATIVNYA